MSKILICLALLSLPALATANESQLGVILGSISGISAKHDLGGERAIDGALAYSLDGQYGLTAHADYLFNPARTVSLGQVTPLGLYYGIGMRFIEYRNRAHPLGTARIGARFPVGLFYRTGDPNLEIFGELAPVLDFTPRTDAYVDAGLGVRFIF